MKTERVHWRIRRWAGTVAAFTIVEIMIVIGIIALLASIAVPYYVRYRTNAQSKSCISNLRQLDAAKEQWALENQRTTGDSCNITNIVGADRYIKNTPSCPSTTAPYVLGNVGEKPTCFSGLPEHTLF